MITYFKMKRNEWKVKAIFYGTIIQIMNNSGEIKDIIGLIMKLYDELKDVPTEDLQREFVSALVGIIHDENQKDNV